MTKQICGPPGRGQGSCILRDYMKGRSGEIGRSKEGIEFKNGRRDSKVNNHMPISPLHTILRL